MSFRSESIQPLGRLAVGDFGCLSPIMLVIRRKVTRRESYTVFMLPGFYQEWPTTDYEHNEILALFKQDRPYEGIVNDFSEFRIGPK